MSLNALKHAFRKQLLHSKPNRRPQNNLTTLERQGLTEINANKNIIIKNADKGSGAVVMNTTDYLREGYRQLSASNFYTKIDDGPIQTVSDKISKVLISMKQRSIITDKNYKYLTILTPRKENFISSQRSTERVSQETNLLLNK